MKRALAVTLAVFMMVALVPSIALAEEIKFDGAEVTNYQQSSGMPYNAQESRDNYFVIRAPYDDIARSAPPAGRFGVNYLVKFFLDRPLDEDVDTVYLNGSKLTYGSYNNGRATFNDRDSVISCIFNADQGGDRETFTIRIYNSDDKRSYSQSVTVVYYDTEDSGYYSDNYYTNYDYYYNNWYYPDDMWHTGSSSRYETMRVSAYASAAGYAVSTTNDIIYIDYDSDVYSIGKQIDVAFTFSNLSGNRLPISGLGVLTGVKGNGNAAFINSSSYRSDRGQFTGPFSMPVTVDPSNTKVAFEVASGDRIYTTIDYTVIWRDKTQLYGADNLSISPSRAPSLVVGQEYSFNITSNNLYNTGNYFTLEVAGNAGVVTTATGKYLTIRALAAGTTRLNVRDAWGTILTTIPVTVKATTSTAPTGAARYQVNAYSLNVRSGPGVNYPVVGKATAGTQVTVNSITGDWANVQWGNANAFVSARYLTYIGGVATTPATPAIPAPSTPPASSGQLGSLGGRSGAASSAGASGGYYYAGDGTFMTVDVSWTDVLDGPGRGYSYIATANRGERVLVYEITDGWARVSWNRGLGFMYAGHLR